MRGRPRGGSHVLSPASPERASREEVLTSHRPGQITRRSSTAIASSSFLLGHMFSPDIIEAFQKSQTALPALPRTRSPAGGRSRLSRRQGRSRPGRRGTHPRHPPHGAALSPRRELPARRPPAARQGWAGLGWAGRLLPQRPEGASPRPSPGQRGAASTAPPPALQPLRQPPAGGGSGPRDDAALTVLASAAREPPGEERGEAAEKREEPEPRKPPPPPPRGGGGGGGGSAVEGRERGAEAGPSCSRPPARRAAGASSRPPPGRAGGAGSPGRGAPSGRDRPFSCPRRTKGTRRCRLCSAERRRQGRAAGGRLDVSPIRRLFLRHGQTRSNFTEVNLDGIAKTGFLAFCPWQPPRTTEKRVSDAPLPRYLWPSVQVLEVNTCSPVMPVKRIEGGEFPLIHLKRLRDLKTTSDSPASASDRRPTH
ncbi:translation initiation factor IF-2-like [Manacus candei]|uniref:translation initiation factor IF-2-like n=1 Tax=Manacus candei TaxID=415023 RepID=UPI002225F3E7|nr:translation initiation factor IF-2-like [Manacus candei]